MSAALKVSGGEVRGNSHGKSGPFEKNIYLSQRCILNQDLIDTGILYPQHPVYNFLVISFLSKHSISTYLYGYIGRRCMVGRERIYYLSTGAFVLCSESYLHLLCDSLTSVITLEIPIFITYHGAGDCS